MTATQPTRFPPLRTHNVTLPAHLQVLQTRDNILQGSTQSFGYDGKVFVGVAFIQGGRLQFTTAMPLAVLHEIAKIDRAKAGDNVTQLQAKPNRPRIAGHSKMLHKYLVDNACAGVKFVLPAFTLNFGDAKSTPEDAPTAVLHVFASESPDSWNGWPARFELPRELQCDATDGAHRLDETEKILKDTRLSQAQRDNLGRNAVPVTIIFESKRVDSHQDFADCARAKPITGSIIASFDVRDLRNNRTVKLVESVPFLKHYVDATAANVNLSAGSIKIWSMSALRGFIGHVQDTYPPAAGGDAGAVEALLVDKLQGADAFFNSLVKFLPQLHTLELARLEAEARRAATLPPDGPACRTETPGTFRNKRGGDVALRGIGVSLFARAFVYAKEHGLTFDAVAEKLARVDWHVLNCEKTALPDPTTEAGRSGDPTASPPVPSYAEAVRKHTVETWKPLVVVGESRFRIGSSNDEANAAWERIKAAHFDPIAVAAE